jgi:hypothetical protein
MALVTVEVIWLQWLLEDFGISVSIPTPLLLYSTGAISIARDPVKHEFTKHIGVDAHFTRSQVQDSVVCCRSSVCAFKALVCRFLHEGSDSCPTSVLSLQTQCS